MREVVVISGKGGTGKTSMVASFAALAQNTVLADCDVDAADLHLVLNPEINLTEPFSGGKTAEILPDRCNGCGECEQVCRFDAISEETNGMQYRVDPISCEGCGVCVAVCPAEAISFEPRQNGELFLSSTKYGPMVHARLGIAEENSGKLVSLVRARARLIAENDGRDLVIIDGPPGTGCPVISSITGAHAVLIVTEPTVSGIHDLKRVVELAAHFKIPACVCINKHDINPQVTREIEDLTKSMGLPLLGKIRYDPVITRAQIRGVPVVEYDDNRVSEEIKAIWDALGSNVLQ